MKVRFSILIPAYNRGTIIRQTIDSVLAQSFTGFEAIVIDDGSTDETPGVLRSYGDRIKVIRQENSGPEVARNNAAARSDGEYLVFLDSDDLLHPGALEIYDRIINEFHAPPLIFGAMTYFEDGQPVCCNSSPIDSIEVLEYRDYLAKEIPIGMSSSRTVVRKSAFTQIGGYHISAPTTFPLDDFDLAIRMGTSGPCLVVLKPACVAYRVHKNNTIHNTKEMVNGILRVIKSEHQGRYPGGKSRRFDRYSYIGGITYHWCKIALKRHHPFMALRLLKSGWPMVMAGCVKKLGRYLQRHVNSVTIPLPWNDRLSNR